MGAAGQPLLPCQCPRRGRQALQMSPSGTRWAEQFRPHHSHVPGQPPLPVNHSPMCPQSCWFFMAPAHMCRHTQAWHVCTQVWIHIHTVNKRGHGHKRGYTRVDMRTHAHVWIHTCGHMHTQAWIHMCGYTQTHTHTVSYRSRAMQHPREFVKWGEDPCSLRGSDWPQLPGLPGGPPVMFWSHPILQRPSSWGPYLAQQPHA